MFYDCLLSPDGVEDLLGVSSINSPVAVHISLQAHPHVYFCKHIIGPNPVVRGIVSTASVEFNLVSRFTLPSYASQCRGRPLFEYW